MDTLEKTVNAIRISPHSFATFITSAAIITTGIFTATHGQFSIGVDELTTGLLILPLAYNTMKYSKAKYNQYKRVIEKYEKIEKEHVKHAITYSCDRQAYKAAAYSKGYHKEFNEINKNHPKHLKKHTWAPEI